MIIKKLNFIPVLLGSDINTYSMARAFHEEYSIKSMVIGKYSNGPSYNSKIIDFTAIETIDEDDCFMRIMNEISLKNKNKKLILIGCGDNYVSLISKNKYKLPNNFIIPYIDYEIMEKLIKKEKFYEICQKHNIDYPKTFIHKKEMGENFTLPFNFPVIVKPSNSVEYWNNSFTSQKKVYKLNNHELLNKVLKEIYNAGYKDTLIIQDYIPGDDTYMHVMTCYSDKNKKVKLMALGHVLLEEHTPHGLGNHAVIINEINDELINKIKKFLEDIDFYGFSNFDIKYDTRDGKYKIFEINLRQGRSNFYVTGAGYNLAKYLVDDYIYNKELEFTVVKNKKLWLVVPIKVAFKYVKPQELKNEMKLLIQKKDFINPLFYKNDYKVKRLLYLLKSHLSHFIKYKKYYV
ncbi:MAG: ATP-grasp domain-containing protein [Patescibacteria group bacterium]|nr:ATP-grasp domain-containing protein [Patescibacteria group bacterium]